MRKFKHKNSNSIVSGDSEKGYKLETGYLLPAWVVENSNNWDEIKEFPKIISFRRISDKMLYTLGRDNLYWGKEAIVGHTLDTMMTQSENKGYTEIYQVAVSETKVLKLGDLVNNPKLQRPMPFVITKFYFDCNNEHILCNGECCGNGHISVMKVEHYTKQEPLFISADNVGIFKEDIFYVVMLPTYNIRSNVEVNFLITTDLRKRIFSTRELAEEYVAENKPIYSKKQIEEALNYGTYIFVDVELFKSRLGL